MTVETMLWPLRQGVRPGGKGRAIARDFPAIYEGLLCPNLAPEFATDLFGFARIVLLHFAEVRAVYPYPVV